MIKHHVNDTDFETLLRMKNRDDHETVVDSFEQPKQEPLMANASASIDDFVEMLARIVAKVMNKQKVEFKPDEGARLSTDVSETIDHPYILFKILHGKPSKEVKPRVRQMEASFPANGSAIRKGEIWGQTFNYLLQFDIFAGGYDQATQVMKDFEDIIFSYTAYFKRNGVKDIRSVDRLTDSNLDIYRQKSSVRSLQYDVDIERLFARIDTEIDGIDVR